MSQFDPPLVIIAQPKPSFRERYLSEISGSRHRAQRFIRAISSNDQNYPYPTIEIPPEWKKQPIYIRVISVTVLSDDVPYHCVHPYPIGTPKPKVIRDKESNSLFFPVSTDELNEGRKSFHISRQKLVHMELKNCFPLFLLDTNQKDTQPITDVRQLIDRYQLNKFQLVFSIASLLDNERLPVIYATTSAFSIIMGAETSLSVSLNSDVRYAPRRGGTQGGEEILMVLPRLDRRKALTLHFEKLAPDVVVPVQITYVDSKTVSFRTPRCPKNLQGDQTLSMHIVAIQNNEEIARVDFLYQSSEPISALLPKTPSSLSPSPASPCPDGDSTLPNKEAQLIQKDD